MNFLFLWFNNEKKVIIQLNYVDLLFLKLFFAFCPHFALWDCVLIDPFVYIWTFFHVRAIMNRACLFWPLSAQWATSLKSPTAHWSVSSLIQFEDRGNTFVVECHKDHKSNSNAIDEHHWNSVVSFASSLTSCQTKQLHEERKEWHPRHTSKKEHV